jgi:WD40 repeat protein
MAQVFDIQTGRVVVQSNLEKSENNAYIHPVCFDPDGRYLATCGDDRRIRVSSLSFGNSDSSSFLFSRRAHFILSLQ